MKRIIYKLLILVVLLLPVLNYPPLFAPPDFGKSMVFRTIFLVLFLLFTYYLFFHKDTEIFEKTVATIKKGGALFYTPLAFLGILIVATLFSLDPLFSVFGDPYRGGGLLTLGMVILFSYMLLFSLDKDDWKKLWIISFFAGFIVSCLAIVQWLGLWSEVIEETSRPYSSLGNPIILSTYTAFLIFPLLSFFLKEKETIKKYAYFLLMLLFSFIILITYTRAVFIGLFFGLLYLLIFYPKKGRMMLFMRVSAIAIVLLATFSVYYINNHEKPEFIAQNSVLNRFTERLDVDMLFKDPRIGGFMIGWSAIKERPVLGYGPENFAIAFNKHYYPQKLNIDRDVPWWDRAHNSLIEMAVWGGIPAAIAFILLFVFLFTSLQKNKNTEKHILQSGLITFFVAMMFSIDSFVLYFLFFIFFAYVSFLFTGEVKNTDYLKSRKKIASYEKPVLLSLFIIFSFFIYSFNLLPLVANKNITEGSAYLDNKRCEEALYSAEVATSRKTIIDAYLYSKKAEIMDHCLETNQETGLLLYETINKALEKRPLDSKNLINKVFIGIKIMRHLGEEDAQLVMEGVLDAIEKLKEHSPNRYEGYKEEARIMTVFKDYDAVYSSAGRCIELNNNEGYCFFLRALGGAALGKEGVQGDMEKAEERSPDIRSENNINLLINAYAEDRNYKEIILLFEELIKAFPENAQYHISLAVNFRETGDYDKAREYALKALKLQPDAGKQIQEFLNTLK